MLRELHVRGLGVLDDVEASFSPGLNVVTGETGAGKTLLVTSLGLLTGGRGESRLVASDADEAVVEAIVDVPGGIREEPAERGLDTTDELVVVRRVGAGGRSRAWLAGGMVPMSSLAEVVGSLVEIHGQGAGFALARPAEQLAALDAFAGTEDLLETYRTALRCRRDLMAELERLEAASAESRAAEDLLSFQVSEIERAEIHPDEDERIASEMGRLEHAEGLLEKGVEALGLIGGDGAAARLADAAKLLGAAADLDPSAGPLAERIGGLAAEAQDASREVRAWAEGLEPDPGRLDSLRERSALLGSLKRKYGSTLTDVLATAAEARERLGELEHLDGRIDEVGKGIQTVTAELDELGRELSTRRRRASAELARLVSEELPALALPNARFEVRCDDSGAHGPSGRDRVAFLFSANPSGEPGPIGKVASGGELSRAMIAVTLALAQTHPAPVLVFDEADQGVGGRAALDLARRLARLGRSHQVLVVSHLPQIAAFADRHVHVQKEDGRVSVRALSGEERLGEISRMLAGLGSSDLARAHAAELVELAESERGPIPASR